jgi:pyruvate/2-oxoglutarate dehydrogenase complex dihydrolipoamide dehydrogenase (E3) component
MGGGTAGLVCAAGAAGLGARVALIEKSRLGGDCLHTGCVPSKALLHAARRRMDFASAMAHVRASRDAIAPHDSPERFRSLGVDVIFGAAAFADRRTVRVGDARLRFTRAVIATGSRPTVPHIDGLQDLRYLTNENVFDLTTQPRSLTILGGGPVGCELAQAFARLGTRVTLVEAGRQLLPREDLDAAALVAAALAADGVEIRTGTTVRSARELAGDAVLIAVGRQATVKGLGLDAAGVACSDEGVHVDDRLRTTNPRVYASGDVCSRFKFTHAADAMSRIVVQNALFFGRKRASALVIPWCTFTTPEVAHVGIAAAETARQRASTITVPLTDVDRAVVDEDTGGFVRVHHRAGRILGATIVAAAAGEMIGTVAYAMRQGGTLGDLAAAIFPYPTLSTALRQAGDIYQRTRLTPAARRALDYYFRRRR